MKKSATGVALAAMAVLLVPSAYAETDAPAPAVKVERGAKLYSSAGNRIGSVYRVTAEGNPQVILNGRIVTVPASSLTDVNGKLTTSLSKRELARTR